MANIRGISIKAVKHFIGTEGPAYQGNIYIGSKKVSILVTGWKRRAGLVRNDEWFF